MFGAKKLQTLEVKKVVCNLVKNASLGVTYRGRGLESVEVGMKSRIVSSLTDQRGQRNDMGQR